MTVDEVISALQAAFHGQQIALPGTEAYASWNASYHAQQESDLQPACIFRPASPNEVAWFVRSAVKGKVAFAIRAGGNMTEPGCANIQDGITLDLGYLTDVVVDHEYRMVHVSAGARWQAVYEAVQAAGLGVVGGRSGTSGVGGSALAGGISFFSAREGFICDNVINFQIVLASGKIVNANRRDNPDLWIALRGGSNNFGIVTRFDIRTFDHPYPLWGGSVYYFLPRFAAQIDYLVEHLHKSTAHRATDIDVLISVGHMQLFGAIMCANTVYYTGPRIPGTSPDGPDLAPFATIKPHMLNFRTMKEVKLAEAAAEPTGGQMAGANSQARRSYMNTTVKADSPTLKAAADLFIKSIAPLAGSVASLDCSFTLQPYSVSLLQQSRARGGNSLGLDPDETGPLVSILLLTSWEKRSDDERVGEAMRAILDGIRRIALDKNTAVDFVDLSHAAGFQGPIASYGSENRRRLREVSKKYDAKGLFQKGVPGGFKLL